MRFDDFAKFSYEFGELCGVYGGVFDESDWFAESGECVYERFCGFAELPCVFHGLRGGVIDGGDVREGL